MLKKYDWNELYEEYLKSGHAKSTFAKEKGISSSLVYTTFQRIEAQLEKEKLENPFVPVSVIADVNCTEKIASDEGKGFSLSSEVELEFCGLTIKIKDGFSKETLHDILEVVGYKCFE